MKDLEKIQSPDLGCQIQDANPGNFAIEQEVAQLVGATVPQPTEPSADDARELGAQLLVFLRRALLPIRSALRTAVAAIYAHLDSRCTDYTPAGYDPFRLPAGPYDPMRPFVPRTLPNLLTAITAFSDRKISGVLEAADGISLVHLLCDPASITELTDNNVGWILTKTFSAKNYFPNSNKVQLGCGEIQVPFEYAGGVVFGSDEEYKFTALKKITPSTAGGYGHGIFNGNVQSHDIDCGDLEEITPTGGFFGLIRCSGSTTDHRYALIARKLRICPALFSRYDDSQIGITKVVLGKIETNNFQPYYIYGSAVRTPNIIHWEFGQDTAVSLNLTYWNPTNALSSSASDLVADPTAHPTWKNLDQFLQNFREHIALRLTSNGSGLTLTLSQAVRDAIHAAEATYGIEAIIVTQKGWTLSPAPTA